MQGKGKGMTGSSRAIRLAYNTYMCWMRTARCGALRAACYAQHIYVLRVPLFPLLFGLGPCPVTVLLLLMMLVARHEV